MEFSYNINFKQNVIDESGKPICCVVEDLDKKLLNEVEEALEIKLSKFILNSVFEITNDNSDIKELYITIKNLINAMLNKYNIDKENKYTMELTNVLVYTKDDKDIKEDIAVDVLYDIDILVKSR